MTDKALKDRMFKIAKAAGFEVLVLALTLWYCSVDRSTPTRVRALILGKLAYFVSPLDAIPDPIPILGFTDDLALLTAAVGMIAAHIKPEHRSKARETARSWVGEPHSAISE